MFDWSFNVGNLLTIVSFLAGGLVFIITMRGRVDALSSKMLGVESELKKLVEVLVQQGRHEERMNAMDDRISAQGQRLDESIGRVNRIVDDKH